MVQVDDKTNQCVGKLFHILYIEMQWVSRRNLNEHIPDRKVHGANMGPTWGRQDPGGPQVGHMKIVIWDAKLTTDILYLNKSPSTIHISSFVTAQITHVILLFQLIVTFLWNITIKLFLNIIMHEEHQSSAAL